MNEAFDVDRLRAARQGARLGHTVHFFDCTDSTNTQARLLAADSAAEGTVVIADQQTAGRGRLGRNWSSPARRNLYLSLVLRPTAPVETVPQLTLVAGLAACRAAQAWQSQARIKWPNDIVVAGRKVAGILTEMEASPSGVAFVIVGIGININITPTDLPEDLREKAGALSWPSSDDIRDMKSEIRPLPRESVAISLLAELETAYGAFERQGFGALRAQWDELSLLAGRSVRIDAGGEPYAGVVLGLNDDGTLRLRAEDGSEKRVVAGDVTVLDGYR